MCNFCLFFLLGQRNMNKERKTSRLGGGDRSGDCRWCTSSRGGRARRAILQAWRAHLLWLAIARLLHCLRLLTKDELHVTRRRHVRVDSAVGSVCSATKLGRTVHLNVLDEQGVEVQTLNFRIGFGIGQQIQQVATRLLGPSSLGGLVNFGLRVSSNTTMVTTEWHGVLVVNDITQELLCTLQRQPLDGVGGFTHVLVVGSQVGTLGLA